MSPGLMHKVEETDIDEFKDAFDDEAYLNKETEELYHPEVIKELEEVFHDAHENIVQ
jgi:hypothetical protein